MNVSPAECRDSRHENDFWTTVIEIADPEGLPDRSVFCQSEDATRSTAPHRTRLVLDMRRVETLTYRGVVALLDIRTNCRAAEVIAVVSEAEVAAAFTLSGLDRYLTVTDRWDYL